MKNIGKNIGDLIFPALFIIGGGLILFNSVFGGQNVFWVLGGGLILTVGIFTLLLKYGKLNNMIQKVLFFTFLPLAFVTAYFSYRSIQAPIEFNQEKKKRYAKVEARLKTLRDWQLAYKSMNKNYASNFDSLIQFVNTGSFVVVKAIGTVPDSLTEQKAIELGIVSRDTIMVSVRDSLFKLGGDINDVKFIPYSQSQPFVMKAGMVEKGQVQVPVFYIQALNQYIFDGIEPEYYDPNVGLEVGSMTEPSTSGNWE
jgi:hypothetical protein